MSALTDAARRCGEHGLSIFPCRPGGKRPLTENGFHDATTDPDIIAAWWTQWPDANIGLVPGRAGYVVIDWDTPEGQREAQRLGLYAEPTLVVETARGEHIYGQHPGGHIGNRKLAPGLDVRADAGYVLLPPSVHPTGAIYTAHGTFEMVRPLPPTVITMLRKPEPRITPRGAVDAPVDAGTPRRVAYVRAAIEDECMALAHTPEGGRNDALNRAAFSLARFVATDEANPEKLADALRYAAQHAGLPEWEIERTIRSAFDARGVAV